MKTLVNCAKNIEMRRANRYRVRTPVQFLWIPQDGQPQSGMGATRDITPSSVYVESDVMPPVGALIQMSVLLPKLGDTGTGMHLNGEGIVLRVEEGEATGNGFAASVQFYMEAMEQAFSDMNSLGQVE